MKNSITVSVVLCIVILSLMVSCGKDDADRGMMHEDTIYLPPNLKTFYMLEPNITLTLDATTTGALSYRWLPTNETSATVEFIYNDYLPSGGFSYDEVVLGGYEVEVTMPETILHYAIGVAPSPFTLYVPNSFTPNGDGRNDSLKIFYHHEVDLNSLLVSIYNSHEKLVFQTDKHDEYWDGTWLGANCEAGYYYYIIHYKTLPGNSCSKDGMLQLIR